MIDDEKLQELLGRASSLYNNGQYQGAIEAWQEALSVDPSSQKAREGIRMATLLIGEWEPSAAAGAGEDAATADAGAPDPAGMPAEEVEARLDFGMARVKQLLAGRRFEEAIEGAKSLMPLAPESEALRRLIEEAQHGFESAPFIDEHLTLARELLDQERYAEAETECRKVFVIDANHPAGRALMSEIKDRVQASLQRAASQMGGMTVKLSLPQIPRRHGSDPSKPGAPSPAAEPAAPVEPAPEQTAPEEPLLEDFAAFRQDAGEPPAAEPAGALDQEEVRARNLLDQAFEQAGVPDEAPGAGLPISDVPETAESPFELSHGPAAPEVVEARTVVPPSVRTSTTAPPEFPSRPAAPGEAAAAAPGRTATAAAKPGQAAQPGRTTPARPAPTAPAKPAPVAPGAHAAPPGAGKPAAADPGDDPSAWEAELAQLNLKEGERGILKGTGARPGSVPAAGGGDVDLMSLLDDDIGGPAAADPGREPAAAKAPAGPAPKPAAKRPAQEPKHAGASGGAAVRETPAERPRGIDRPRPVIAPAPARSSGRGLLTLFVLLLLAGGGAAWYFYFQPRISAASAGAPGQVSAPPQGTPAGPEAVDGPIPTPIGGPSRPQGEGTEAGNPSSGAVAAAGEPGAELPAVAGTPADPTAPAPAALPAAGGAPAAHPAGGTPARPLEPIKPYETPRLSPEETRRRVAAFSADGRRLMAQGKWREARAKFNAVLALDPANLDIKDIADQAQAKIDEEQRLETDMDSAKQLMQDKDYENALRKLYRMPRDKGLGDIDLFIRNAWFNWAVVQLKAGNSKDAINKLNEVLTLDPDDAEALRLQEVAERYTAKAKDRVYYAFTDTLKLRAFDQRR